MWRPPQIDYHTCHTCHGRRLKYADRPAARTIFKDGVGRFGDESANCSPAVSQRAQEIGVRVALGAQPRDNIRMVAGNAARLGAFGLVLGVVLAHAAGRSMQALLAGVRPSDSQAFGAAVALTALMLVAGTLVPTLRALRIDPLSAIRSE